MAFFQNARHGIMIYLSIYTPTCISIQCKGVIQTRLYVKVYNSIVYNSQKEHPKDP